MACILLLHKRRRAMVGPDRGVHRDLAGIGGTGLLIRCRRDAVDRPRGGRSPVGKIFIVRAVELSEDRRVTLRMAAVTVRSPAAAPGPMNATMSSVRLMRSEDRKRRPRTGAMGVVFRRRVRRAPLIVAKLGADADLVMRHPDAAPAVKARRPIGARTRGARAACNRSVACLDTTGSRPAAIGTERADRSKDARAIFSGPHEDPQVRP